jgi:hypothetical protein
MFGLQNILKEKRKNNILKITVPKFWSFEFTEPMHQEYYEKLCILCKTTICTKNCEECKKSYCNVCMPFKINDYGDYCEDCMFTSIPQCSVCEKLDTYENMIYLYDCISCKKKYCDYCKEYQEKDYSKYCEDCMDVCENCDVRRCINNMCDISECKHLSCEYCVEKCNSCRNMMCNYCMIICDVCSEKYCNCSNECTNCIENNLILTRNERKYELIMALRCKGLLLRSDSKYCRLYIDHNEGDIDDIVQRMCEMKFLYDYCNFKNELKIAKQEQIDELNSGYFPDCPVFDQAEMNVLIKIGKYPKVFPWQIDSKK